MKKGKKQKAKKNKTLIYIIIGIILLGLISWYIASWYEVKQKEKYLESYLVTTNTLTYEINSLEEISAALQESPSEYFVYVSYKGDKQIYGLEKKLKKTIDEYNLKDYFYFINVTDIKDDEDLLTKLNDHLNTSKIKTVPCLLYYSNGSLEEIIQIKGSVFTNEEFLNLLKNYDYEKISQ